MRKVLLFFMSVLLALTAGRAFWVSLGENPFAMSGATYVEFFQQLDKRIAIPIAVTGIGGTLLAGISALVHKDDRRTFYLLLAAFGCGLVGSLVTIIVNVPINERVAMWNPAALPAGYEVFLRRWWEWHQVQCSRPCVWDLLQYSIASNCVRTTTSGPREENLRELNQVCPRTLTIVNACV